MTIKEFLKDKQGFVIALILLFLGRYATEGLSFFEGKDFHLSLNLYLIISFLITIVGVAVLEVEIEKKYVPNSIVNSFKYVGMAIGFVLVMLFCSTLDLSWVTHGLFVLNAVMRSAAFALLVSIPFREQKSVS